MDRTCIVCLNNNLIFTGHMKDHTRYVQKILAALLLKQSSVKAKNCTFYLKEVKYQDY